MDLGTDRSLQASRSGSPVLKPISTAHVDATSSHWGSEKKKRKRHVISRGSEHGCRTRSGCDGDYYCFVLHYTSISVPSRRCLTTLMVKIIVRDTSGGLAGLHPARGKNFLLFHTATYITTLHNTYTADGPGVIINPLFFSGVPCLWISGRFRPSRP